MFRLVFYLFLSVVLISIVRAILGVILKGFSSLFQTTQPAHPVARATGTPLTGELKRDPVCGTYTVASNAIQHSVKGETFYFCSARCRDEFAAQRR
jgi:YHS domain-containing protein